MKLVLAIALAGAVLTSGVHPRTYAYTVRGKPAGSIERDSGGFWNLRGAFYECSGPPGEAELYRDSANRGVIWLHLDGMTVAGSARRQSSAEWRIFGDPAIGATRIGVTRRAAASRWDVYSNGRRIGNTKGPDGPAAALALIFC